MAARLKRVEHGVVAERELEDAVLLKRGPRSGSTFAGSLADLRALHGTGRGNSNSVETRES